MHSSHRPGCADDSGEVPREDVPRGERARILRAPGRDPADGAGTAAPGHTGGPTKVQARRLVREICGRFGSTLPLAFAQRGAQLLPESVAGRSRTICMREIGCLRRMLEASPVLLSASVMVMSTQP